MPVARISEPTEGQTLRWLVQQPAESARALGLLSAFVNMQLTVAPVSDASRLKQSLIMDKKIAQLPLPIGLPFPYGAPTGTQLRATFDANESTTVSSPPTQAEVEAIQSRLTQTRQIMAALISDLTAAGFIDSD